jgi:hypothetical protein
MLGLSADDVVQEIEAHRPEASAVLDRLSAALLAAERLTVVGDEVVDHFVQQARAAGVSWSEIGQCMGVSKQAVQKRYVAPRTDPSAGTADGAAPAMRRVVDLATQEARALGHPYVGTEHLVLGALRADDPVTAAVLAAVDIDEARALIAGTVPPSDVADGDRLPLTPRSKKALETAMAQARSRGEDVATRSGPASSSSVSPADRPPSGRDRAPTSHPGPSWETGAVNESRVQDREEREDELAALVGEWLDWSQASALLGVSVSKVRQLIREHALAAVVPAPGAGQQVPAELLQDGMVVKGLPGVLTVLHDGGYDDREALTWLFTADDTLPGRPIDALRENRGSEVKRRAQAMAF